jgi:hypothetical protein
MGRDHALWLPLVLFGTVAFALLSRADPEPDASAWFTNVAALQGLEEVRAKDCLFTDLDGDGFWDLCLDRQRLYRNDGGTGFHLLTDTGLVFPEILRIPLGADGQPDREKARTGPYVPHYLYFADVDNDGHQDALAGMHCWWESPQGATWKRVSAADPGVRSRVWLGTGAGRFRPGPESAYGSDEALGPAMALAIVDVDGDGCLDLFEGREYRRYGVLENCGVDRLWMGDGGGGFRDGTRAAGLWTDPQPGGPHSSRPTYGVTHADWNNDGLPDLLQLSYGRQWNYLWQNRGDGTFEDVGQRTMFAGDEITHGRYPEWLQAYMQERGQPARPDEQPFRSNGNTFDCAVGDIDNDGDLDCFLGEICHEWAGEASDLPALLVNQGASKDFVFERRSVKAFLPPRAFRPGSRWNYGDLHTAFLDVDNDGRLDLLIGSGDYPDGQYLRLYQQQADGSFEERTERAGFRWEGCGGLSIGDFDRDGDVDILAGRSFMRLSQAHRDKYMDGIQAPLVGLFRNDIGNRSGNHWANVRLEGGGAGASNRSGIGARVRITAGGVTQMREIRSGSGLSNHQDPPEACFGLGRARVIDVLEVRWPDRAHSVQVFRRVPVDRFLVVREGEAELVSTPR